MSSTWSMTGKRSAKVVCTTGSETVPSNPAKASGTATLSSTVAGDILTVNGMAFTGSDTDNTGQSFQIGASDTATAVNIAAAINRYSVQLQVSATSAAAVVTITALAYGTLGNAITLAETSSTITVSGANLSGGVEYEIGALLADVVTFDVLAEAVTSAQTIAGGTLQAYLLNDQSVRWVRTPGLDLTPGSALQGYGFTGFTVSAARGRLIYVPSGVTISSGSMAIYINCSFSDGRSA